MRVRDSESYVEGIIEHLSYAIADVHILSRPRATVAGDRPSQICFSYRDLAYSFSFQSSRPPDRPVEPRPGSPAAHTHGRASGPACRNRARENAGPPTCASLRPAPNDRQRIITFEGNCLLHELCR